MKIKLLIFSLLFSLVGWGQTFYDMSSGNYSQDFNDVTNWTNNYASGIGAANWRVSASVATSVVNTNAVFVTTTTGGVQKGTTQTVSVPNLVLLATGTNSSATEVLLNFTNRTAGSISFDWSKIVNTASVTPRTSDVKVQYSIDNGVTFSDLTGYTIPRVNNNATAESGSVTNIALPAALNNQSQVVIRFYVWNNGQAGGSGNRPKIGIDNIGITSTPIATSPEINIQGNSTTIADGDITPAVGDDTDFGTTTTSTNVTKTYIIQNIGTANLSVTNVAMNTGSVFTIGGISLPATILPGTSTTFTVTFNSASTGTFSDTVLVTSDDADEATYDYNVTATIPAAASPEINVQGNSITIASGDVTPSTADHTDFGTVNTASGTIVRTFTIENTGSATLNIGSVSISGANAGDFSVTASPSATVAAGGSTTFQVTFDPSADGVRAATITVSSDDADEANYAFGIQGTGISAPVITSSLTANGTQNTAFSYTILATNSPTSYGATGLPAGLSINTGTGAITGTPTVSGVFNISISATNVVGTDTQTLVLTLAVGPCLSDSFTSVTFPPAGWIATNVTRSTTAVDYNSGPAAAIFGQTTGTLAMPSVAYPTQLKFYLGRSANATAKTLTVEVSTVSQVAGFTTIATYDHNNVTASSYNQYTIDLSSYTNYPNVWIRFVKTSTTTSPWRFDDVEVYCGTPTFPEMDIKGNSVSIADGDSTPDVADNTDFGSVLIASPLAKTFTIENTGIDPLKLFGSSPYITISGANASDFSVSIVPASTVAASGSTTFEITFQPSAIGLRTAAISILNDDINENPYNFNIQGTGVFCVNTTTWDGVSWSNGTPDSTKNAVLNGNYTTSVATPSFISCSLVVNAGVTLTVSSNDYVEVGHDVVNYGTVTVQDDASLVQSDNTAIYSGTGTNNMIRTAQNLKQFDYVYWSSPIVTAPFTTIANSRFYEWDADVVNPAGYGQGNWINTADANMVPGKGYAFRVPNNDPTQTVTFTGSLFNNGVISKTINKGTITAPFAGANATITEYDDNWNLVGNPYPSAIDTQTFATDNSAVLEDGTVYLWRHLTSPTTAANPYYQSYTYNNVSSDYVRHNGTASIPAGAFDGKIAAGQGFFVKMKESLGSGSANLEFNNGQRSRNHNNSQFFRTSSPSGELQKSRIWLDLINPDRTVKTQVVAYVEGATNGEDFYFDSKSSYKSGFSFHSVNGNNVFDIQARAFPFNNNDLVPLGIQLPTTGTYTIAINQTDGFFADRSNKIYLEDKATNVIHDLTLAPYQFTAQQGINNTRFVLRYTANTLGNDDFENVSNSVKVFGRDNTIAITSGTENITSYEVYNVLGQSLATQKNIEKHETEITSVQRNNQALIVKVILENGHTVTRKIIF